MKPEDTDQYVGRGGLKLRYAIEHLALNVRGLVAADFGCNIGGFTDCLLKKGARRVYAFDTGYGALHWKLRNDHRVVVMERTNAMHVALPERVDLVVVDVGWTRQRHILPNALRQLSERGFILSLFKPQYEADRPLVRRGVVPPENVQLVLDTSLAQLKGMGIAVESVLRLPRLKGMKNQECMLYILGAKCVPKEDFLPEGPREN
ncbi:MAG: TlyA family rRNA (cytidine-2'-O)-methyltransferase [Candidatus Brocadiae bacterium]|nr:TlyA family rRNA (cytidine-2'-O)-methyltransferase [Candidatus Brocadiia bacterium]